MIWPEEHLRFCIWVQEVIIWSENEETVVWIEYNLDQISEELFEQTTCISAFFLDALGIDKDNFDMLSQIWDLTQLSVSIFKNCMPFDSYDVVILARSLSLNIDMLCKE